MPSFPSKESFFQYYLSVYKLKMHGFSCKNSFSNIESDWTIYDIKDLSYAVPLFYEMEKYFHPSVNCYALFIFK